MFPFANLMFLMRSFISRLVLVHFKLTRFCKVIETQSNMTKEEFLALAGARYDTLADNALDFEYT